MPKTAKDYMNSRKPKLPPRPVDLIFPALRKFRDEGRCPFCREVINDRDFRDELSRREFEISGLCMKCQDGVFDTGSELQGTPEGDTHNDP